MSTRARRLPRSPDRRKSTRHAPRRVAQAATALSRLVEIMAVLRSPRGCPWDVKQTHKSLRRYLVEETYEALDAMDRGDMRALSGELGDVLFQCVFHAQIAAEAGHFDMADVVNGVADKLVSRHPHVFRSDGTPLSAAERRQAAIDSPAAVLAQWSTLKARERAAGSRPARLLDGVPRALPALQRAYTIGSRVATVGFDWPEPERVMDKIDEEVRELRHALGEGRARSLDELGDLLFSIANLARKLQLEPETALRHANDKFTRRFNALEAMVLAKGRRVEDVPLDELEQVWERVKATQAPRARSTRGRSTSGPARRGRRSPR